METKITCPKCGCEFAIPEHEHLTIGIAVAKDSGLGEIHPPVAKKKDATNKATSRLEALKKAGIDTSGFISLKNSAGDEILAKNDNGSFVILDDNDPIFDKITNGKTIPERRLFRRWVMSQMFHLLFNADGSEKKFDKELQKKGYKYQWKVILDELQIQEKMCGNDYENYMLRCNLFPVHKIFDTMLKEYEKNLQKTLESNPIRLRGDNYFIKIGNKEYSVQSIKEYLNDICIYPTYETPNPNLLSENFKKFNSSWLNGFKKAGVYYTLENLIRFHNCTFPEKSEEESLVIAKGLCIKQMGYRLIPILRDFIKNNGIDPAKEMKDWSE